MVCNKLAETQYLLRMVSVVFRQLLFKYCVYARCINFHC